MDRSGEAWRGVSGGKFQLRLLGTFGLFAPNGERIPVQSKRAVALLAALAMSPTGERSRAWLQSQLWGSRGTEQAQASLRRELSTLVTLLQSASREPLILRSASCIALDLDRVTIDALALSPRTSDDTTLQPEFLEGFDLRACDEFEDWLRAQRRRIDEIRTTLIQAPVPANTSAEDILGGPLPPRQNLVRQIPPPLAPKPSIAILPFKTGGREADQHGRGEMLAEAASMSLARYPHIFVVSTSSAAALVHRGQTAREIAVALGVRYLLEGSLAEGAVGAHVTVRLIEGESGFQRWASTLAVPGGDLMVLQEKIATALAPQIWTHIDQAERHRGLSRRTRIDDSYDLYWRANALFHQWTRASIREALDLTRDLVAREPDSGWAAAICAFCNAAAYTTGWSDNADVARRTALIEYQNALRLEPDNVEVMGYCAGTLALIGGDLTIADHLIDRALSLFPSYQPTLFWGGWVDLANGRPDRASERLELSLRINPVSGVRAYAMTGIGLARLMMGEVVEAYALLFEANISIPTYAVTMAGLYMAARLKGENAVARTLAERLKRSGDVDKVFALFSNPAHRALLQTSLAADT
jgi:TolB-like protein